MSQNAIAISMKGFYDDLSGLVFQTVNATFGMEGVVDLVYEPTIVAQKTDIDDKCIIDGILSDLDAIWSQKKEDSSCREIVLFGMNKLVFNHITNKLTMYEKQNDQWLEIQDNKQNGLQEDHLSNILISDWTYALDMGYNHTNLDDFAIIASKESVLQLVVSLNIFKYFKIPFGSMLIREYLVDKFKGDSDFSLKSAYMLTENGKTAAINVKFNLLKNRFIKSICALLNKEEDDLRAEKARVFEDALAWLFGDEWIRLYRYKHQALSLRSFRKFVSQFAEVKDRLLFWEAYNKNAVMLILRAGCTHEQINNDNLFAYDEVLSPTTPFLPFHKKVQFRNFMKLDLSLAKELYQQHCLAFKADVFQDSNFRYVDQEDAISDQVEALWGVALIWIEHGFEGLLSEPNLEAVQKMQKNLMSLKPLIGEGCDRQLALFCNIIYKHISSVCVVKSNTFTDERNVPYAGLMKHLSFLTGVTHTGGLFDFAKNRNARNTDWNIRNITTKTTFKTLLRKEDEWHNELQEVDNERLMTDPNSLVKYHDEPKLTHVIVGYDFHGYRFNPIRSNRELMIEGREMNHCVYSYDEELQFDEICVYSVEGENERVTASFNIRKNNRHGYIFSFGESSGYKNAQPSNGVDEILIQFAEMLTLKFCK